MRGRYRDFVIRREAETRTPWRPNLVVNRCYQLLALLMKNEPDVNGLLHLAVGDGAGSPQRNADSLDSEVARFAIHPANITLVDSNRLRIDLRLTGEQLGATAALPTVLREFGLFGGDASERSGSGFLINRVVHDPLRLAAGESLERHIELEFGGASGLATPSPNTNEFWASQTAQGPFGEGLAVIALEGVGPATARTFARAGVRTIGDLARRDPRRPIVGVNASVFRELVTKARLVRRIEFDHAAQTLAGRTLGEVVSAQPADVVAMAGGRLSVMSAEGLQHALAVLELALDKSIFQSTRVAELLASPPLWAPQGEFGPFGAEFGVVVVQGIAASLQGRLEAVGVRTVDDLARHPAASLPDVGPSNLRELSTKARIIRTISLPGSVREFGSEAAATFARADPHRLAAPNSALTLALVEGVQDAVRLLELCLDQPVFETIRLGQLIA
jgi:hypothetical protein